MGSCGSAAFGTADSFDPVGDAAPNERAEETQTINPAANATQLFDLIVMSPGSLMAKR